MEQQSENILYETLSPLPLSTLSDVPSRPQSPPLDQLEPYTVFRNEISLSDLGGGYVESPAPDFFSLDVNSSGVDELEEAEPKWQKEPKTPTKELEPRLESGWFRGNSSFKSPMLQLHKEIVDFCDFLSPTPEEQALRNSAVESVFDVIKYIWPKCKPEVFGSFRTGLYLPTSDIDVVILGSGIRNPPTGLQALSRALSQRGIAKKIQVIAKARVPIIKFVEKKSGFSFDISFDAQNGPKAAEFIKDALYKWPQLRPLCLILKVFLQQRELNEVYSGGIGSYALLTMLMAVLKSLYECQTSPEHNLGVLLVHFFDIYGRKLNTTDVGVSCKGKGTFFKKSSKGFTNKGRPFLISIEDPQAPDNDIGKNSFNYFQIKSAFLMALTTLTNPKTIFSLGPNRSILGTIIRPDPVLLERKGGSNGEMTFNNLLPGAGEPLQTQHVDQQQEILCNWQSDYEEESFPRGDDSAQSSEKKRKASSKEKSRKKKVKESGEIERHEESGSRKERSSKKKRWRHNCENANGFS
ncbi:terminal nucleotidyltransferase 4B-like isoform X2 [Pistacia vera]|uniref:terminal nucleotidyltransferase 4B-like isoform X1 n=1 Tax=Pistacia vera TaxID=55513 RepID=UPI001262B97F|nr:terminal nucleotidyltransferase 4B-like isoform X1 [Pistacia vera]XP_031284065.1 terminal nucleotidyltransferase 4B-like isoform X2 [Pistacia vera]